MQIISVDDLPAHVRDHELSEAMVAGANARAVRVAPCLADPDSEGARAEAKLILLGAVQRWSEAGSGAIQSTTAGPFGQTLDTRQRTGFNLWTNEIEVLQDLCGGAAAKVFQIDTMPAELPDDWPAS